MLSIMKQTISNKRTEGIKMKNKEVINKSSRGYRGGGKHAA